MLNNQELTDLIGSGESDRVEFTSSTRDLDKFRRAICAFANDLPDHKKPGVLFIGLNDDGSCANLVIEDDLLQKLSGLRDDGKTLPFPSMIVARKELRGCQVVAIQVEPSENPPVKVDNRCWIRTGPRRGQATADEERRLTEKRRWGNLPYDMHGVPQTTVESDLDVQRFQNEYLPSAIPLEILEENRRDPREQLKALRLVTRYGTPTVTAILILGTDPRGWFPGAYVQFVRYDGDEITDSIVDQAEFQGPLVDQLRETDRMLKRHISTALDTSGEMHVEKPDYPFSALRELAHNAVIHRSYESTNTPVRITWLSDRIEITSPGSAYGSVTRENFGNPGATSYRNPTIAEAMKNLGFMQRFGRGIGIANKALEENGNPPPEFKVEDALVSAIIRRRP